MQLPFSGRVHMYGNRPNLLVFRPNLGLRALLWVGNLEKKTRFLPLLSHSINSCQVYCGLSRKGEMLLQATCYVYVLRLRSVLLKLPNSADCLRCTHDMGETLTLQRLSFRLEADYYTSTLKYSSIKFLLQLVCRLKIKWSENNIFPLCWTETQHSDGGNLQKIRSSSPDSAPIFFLHTQTQSFPCFTSSWSVKVFCAESNLQPFLQSSHRMPLHWLLALQAWCWHQPLLVLQFHDFHWRAPQNPAEKPHKTAQLELMAATKFSELMGSRKHLSCGSTTVVLSSFLPILQVLLWWFSEVASAWIRHCQ